MMCFRLTIIKDVKSIVQKILHLISPSFHLQMYRQNDLRDIEKAINERFKVSNINQYII